MTKTHNKPAVDQPAVDQPAVEAAAAATIVARLEAENALFRALEVAASRKDTLRLYADDAHSVYASISLDKRNLRITRTERKDDRTESIALVVFKIAITQYNPEIKADDWLHRRENPTESVLENVSLAVKAELNPAGKWQVTRSFGFARKGDVCFTHNDPTGGEYNPLLAAFIDRVVEGRKARDARRDTEVVAGERVLIDPHYAAWINFKNSQQ